MGICYSNDEYEEEQEEKEEKNYEPYQVMRRIYDKYLFEVADMHNEVTYIIVNINDDKCDEREIQHGLAVLESCALKQFIYLLNQTPKCQSRAYKTNDKFYINSEFKKTIGNLEWKYTECMYKNYETFEIKLLDVINIREEISKSIWRSRLNDLFILKT